MTKHARVLVVEDDASIRSMVHTVLDRRGFDVKTARDGQEAIDILAMESFDVILLDLMMPVVSGFEVLEFIEHAAPQAARKCVVVLTAVSNAHLGSLDQERVRKVLRKPFDLEELVRTVQECLSESGGS